MIPEFLTIRMKKNKNVIAYYTEDVKQLLSYNVGGNVSKTTSI